jgi:hypothetical protein
MGEIASALDAVDKTRIDGLRGALPKHARSSLMLRVPIGFDRRLRNHIDSSKKIMAPMLRSPCAALLPRKTFQLQVLQGSMKAF